MTIKRFRVRQLAAPRPAILRVAVLVMILGSWFVLPAWSRTKSHTQSGSHAGAQAQGVLTQVHAAYIIVRTDDGKELSLQTREDFRSKVGPGSRVKAWYLPGTNGYLTLEWLEYPWESFLVPWDVIHSQVRKVAILPQSQVPEANGFFDAVAVYLRDNLHWNVPRVSAVAGGSTLDAMDPSTGQFDLAHYTGEGEHTVATLMAISHAQAVLEVDVQASQATVRDRMAIWDGVQEPLGAGPKAGEAPATTVRFKLWGDGGKLLWTNERGFAVLETSEGGKLRDRSLGEVLGNADTVEDWLNMMFSGLIAGPKAEEE